MLKREFAQKMLDERLDFLPLEESMLLKEAGFLINSRFNYVCNIEEIDDELETDREIIEAVLDFYEAIEIGDSDEFDEFTHVLCSAPTYIDLIK